MQCRHLRPPHPACTEGWTDPAPCTHTPPTHCSHIQAVSKQIAHDLSKDVQRFVCSRLCTGSCHPPAYETLPHIFCSSGNQATLGLQSCWGVIKCNATGQYSLSIVCLTVEDTQHLTEDVLDKGSPHTSQLQVAQRCSLNGIVLQAQFHAGLDRPFNGSKLNHSVTVRPGQASISGASEVCTASLSRDHSLTTKKAELVVKLIVSFRISSY